MNIKKKSWCAAEVLNTLKANMRKAKGLKNDEIDAFKTAFWYEEVKRRLNVTTSYEVEQKLDPESFVRDAAGDLMHKSKWSQYRGGLHVPMSPLVNKVDSALPGTKWIINHVLWDTLHEGVFGSGNIESCIKRLDQKIQTILFKTESQGLSINYRRIDVSIRLLSRIENRAGIDALACLTILFREACEAGNAADAILIGQSIHKMLLVLSATNKFGFFDAVLFDIYRDNIYPLSPHNEIEFKFAEYNFSRDVILLTRLIYQAKVPEQYKDISEQKIKIAYKLLKGDYGLEVKFALATPTGPKSPLSEANQKDWESYISAEKYRAWGRERCEYARKPQPNDSDHDNKNPISPA